MSENIDYIHQHTNIVYIFSLGAGSKNNDFSDYEFHVNNISEIISYKGGKKILGIPVFDFLDVKKNIKEIEKIKLEGHGKIDFNKYRLSRLLELLEFYLLNTYLNIVLIGFSHGSVLIQAVILKIKMKGIISREVLKERITIFSVGSPNIIPPDIISKDKTNKIFNIYNIYDNILSLGRIFKITKKDYIPDLSKSHIRTLNFSEGFWKSNDNNVMFKYSFDKEKRIIYINIENIFKYLKISNLLFKQSLRHTVYLNLIVLFKTIEDNSFYSPLFLINFNMRLNFKPSFEYYFIEYDRYFYLYLLNHVPKDTQITVIQRINYDKLLELLNIKELSHLYSLLSPEMSMSKITLFRDEFIMDNLHLLTFNELQLSLLKTPEEKKSISMKNRHDLLKELGNKENIKKFKLAIRSERDTQTINLLMSLYYLYLLSTNQSGSYDKLGFLKQTTHERFNQSLSQLDEEILHSIYIKVNNHNQEGEIFERQNLP